MKKHYLLLITVLCSMKIAEGQFSINIEAGANLSRVTLLSNPPLNFADYYENALGYYLSVDPSFNISKKLKLALAIQYSLEGYNYNDGINEVNSFNLGFFRLSPHAQVKLLGPIYGIAGASWGYLSRQTVQTQSGALTILPQFAQNKRVDYGIISGLRAELSSFVFSLRYNFSLSKLKEISYTDRDGDILGSGKERIRNFQIGLGYRFNLTK